MYNNSVKKLGEKKNMNKLQKDLHRVDQQVARKTILAINILKGDDNE